jgi:excisionase family DNA binding protein
VCRLTGLGRTSVYRLIRSGRIQCHRVGPKNGRFKISRAQVDAYLKSTTTKELNK